PLLSRDESIGLQIRTGIGAYRRHLGLVPKAMWLPECAYRPGKDGRPGIESFLAAQGIQVFFAETDMVEGREVLVTRGSGRSQATVFRPYQVRDSGVSVLARHRRACQQVWGSAEGYPGDFDHQEFHKRERVSGLHYWRITSNEIPLEGKGLYDPARAQARAGIQAEHFAGVVRRILQEHHEATDEFGLLLVAFDTELFGHWWFEGVAWLEAVLRHLASSGEVELTTASDYLGRHPADGRIDLPEGSWGEGGMHAVWDNPKTEWIWAVIHQAEDRMVAAARTSPPDTPVLRQALREFLLLQASDWPFLMTTGQAEAHAVRRFREHVERFNLLMDAHEAGKAEDPLAASIWEIDKVFPDVDVRWFRP
ncbi:MAG TPA: 1,4-alpha-glucan branching protein domain-containing protein, partial [Anaerolineales bacterium]|nr:1,4-alpha-glucan branching protein domain-containing protein [Anaerolineales bacterium]